MPNTFVHSQAGLVHGESSTSHVHRRSRSTLKVKKIILHVEQVACVQVAKMCKEHHAIVASYIADPGAASPSRDR
jgi:hypothetical protein